MTNIWPRNARFVQCFAKVSSPLWERVMGTRLQAADDLPASLLRKVCQCEEGKTKFMGLEMSRHRTIWLSFQLTETAGKKGAVPDFLTLFMLLNSWIKATGKIQKSSPAHTPPPPPPFHPRRHTCHLCSFFLLYGWLHAPFQAWWPQLETRQTLVLVTPSLLCHGDRGLFWQMDLVG